MAKKQFNYSDLSTKELELLKDIYVDQKVKSMSNNDLKNFALEHIALQIKNTIGNEEELEAWNEMEEFFKDEFDDKIIYIQNKMRSLSDINSLNNDKEIKLESEDKEKDKKIDMWED